MAVAYVTDDGGTGADTTYWGVNGYYTFDLASLSVGFETSDDGTTESDGYTLLVYLSQKLVLVL